jgi:hypothetical protein
MKKLILASLALATLAAGGAASVAGSATAQPVVVEERYGHWDPAWGVTPPPPVRRWRHWRGEHEREWYGHVHNCMVRFNTYDARRDMYLEGHRWVACRDDD